MSNYTLNDPYFDAYRQVKHATEQLQLSQEILEKAQQNQKNLCDPRNL